MKTSFVLIDFENVRPKNLSLLSGGPFKIKVFMGENQGNIPLEMARALQEFGPDAEYIQIDGNGRNALDFHIAYYLGRLAAEFQGADFYVISRDKGFDPLLRHLRARGVHCGRYGTIEEVPLGTVPAVEAVATRVDEVVRDLARQKASKPRTLKTLGRSIRALFGNQLSDDELAEILARLTERGVVKVTDNKVSYHLPS